MDALKVKAARKILGLTQRQLEEALNMKGTSGRTIRAWEDPNDERNITGPCEKLLRIFLKHGLNII